MALFNATAMRAGPDAIDALRSTIAHNRAIPPAGKVWASEEEGTAACLKFPDFSGKEIPGAKWRASTEPGVRVRHPAAKDDPVDEKRTYGVSSQMSEHVVDVIEQEPKGVLEGLLRAHGERAYLSTTREPLGKGRVHSGDLPPRVTQPGYAFGMKSASSESAKPLLYPDVANAAAGGDGSGGGGDGGDAAFPERTARYRGTSGPGEQRTRGYDWGKTSIHNPRTHRFGKVDKGALRDGEGAAIALNPARDPAARAPAVIAKRVADYRNVAVDHLGRVKSLGRGDAAPPSEAFGASIVPADEWTAGDCIRGQYSLEDQLPDADLGKSVSKGYRNFTADPNRRFGVPTIRSDIPAKAKASVADHQNYGNDADAASLLHPSRFAPIGVDHSDFVQDRGQSDIRELFQQAGYSFDDEEFQKIWNRAASHYDLSGDGHVSIEEFRLALNEYDDAREEGTQPSWW